MEQFDQLEGFDQENVSKYSKFSQAAAAGLPALAAGYAPNLLSGLNRGNPASQAANQGGFFQNIKRAFDSETQNLNQDVHNLEDSILPGSPVNRPIGPIHNAPGLNNVVYAKNPFSNTGLSPWLTSLIIIIVALIIIYLLWRYMVRNNQTTVDWI